MSGLATWDETIVPALRKRLESESRILAKRISIASVSSTERSLAPSPAPRHLPEPRKSSAIPRPSLQHARPPPDPADPSPRPNGASHPPRRARTYSQPPSPHAFPDNPLPTPASSRPTSPRVSDVKPTRIPIAARARTTSASSHAHSIAHRADSRNGRPYQLPTPDTSHDLPVVKPSDPLLPTTPPTASIRHQPSNIMNEPPPFPAPSFTSSVRSRHNDPAPRPSNDSEERPFEHWYRGDLHRNGGVGERRVAKHVEMLQIANYGHKLRHSIRRQSPDSSPRRRRADSVDGTHESLYLDDAPPNDLAMVLDETPLTDIEQDIDIDPDAFYDAYATADTEMDADDTIHAPLHASSSRSQTPTSACPAPGDIPAPTHAPHQHPSPDPLRSSTSSPPRSSADSTIPTNPSRPRSPSRTISPTSQSSDQSHTKRRAKSPSPASTPKRPRTKAKTPPSASRKDDPRFSIAAYPTPEGDVVHAIPTWTQPVQKSGNWDEVILPVVARKKGLNGQYEQADGSPKPRSPESPVKPAPGTFGFDYTKYRPPRVDEEMELNDFGQIPEDSPLPERDFVPPPTETPPKSKSKSKSILPPLEPEAPIRQDPRQTVPKPPDSPAPFARYHTDRPVPTINVTRPSTDLAHRPQEEEYEDVTGGCCKCVIM